MSLRHLKTEEWEAKLKEIFDRLDDKLEDKYGHFFNLHPARPKRNETVNKEHSGLFNVGASFSLGLGSIYGPGYVIEIRISTLENVAEDLKLQIEAELASILREELKTAFPQRKLEVAKDGNALKIYGDLSLGIV